MAPSTSGSLPHCSASSVPNDQPSSHSRGRSASAQYPIAAATSCRSAVTVTELALAATTVRGRAAGIEPEDRQVGQGWQPVRGLAQQVAVHHAALRRQRMQADQGRDGRAVSRLRELADQRQPVRGHEGDVLPPGGQHCAGRDLSHRVLSVGLQPGARPAGPSLPAGVVPVPPLLRARRARRPDHDVRGPRHEFLIAAGAAVSLGGRRSRHPPHYPVTIRPLLQLRRPEARVRLLRRRCRRTRPAGPPRPCGRVRRQPARLPRAHDRHHPPGLAG